MSVERDTAVQEVAPPAAVFVGSLSYSTDNDKIRDWHVYDDENKNIMVIELCTPGSIFFGKFF